jgi:nicotinate-nucleotide adenylyltransferase
MNALRMYPGQTIGLLGGSFDPPHLGHVHITFEALKQFNLDAVWWLVSPGNPLKKCAPAPLADRMRSARALVSHPNVFVTDIEARLGTRYTAQTLAALKSKYPKIRFVWLMGADNLAQLHCWQTWQTIMETVPIGVLARPGNRISARTSKAALTYRHARIKASNRHLMARMAAPAWCYVNIPLTAASSSAIRAKGFWQQSEKS